MARLSTFLRFGMVLVGLVVLAGLAGMLIPRPFQFAGGAGEAGGGLEILVISNPIHTDIAIPVTDETKAYFADLRDAGVLIDHPAAEWIVFGWGGRSFYLETPTWSELKPMPVMRALTLDRSVMHVDVAGQIDIASPAVQSFRISTSGYKALLARIRESFVLERGVPVLVEGAGYGFSDQFFEAHGSFNALIGCNTWTAHALRSAGLRTGWWNPLPFSLSTSLRLFN
ncbi:TIGR02117 family protein [Rhizobium sp. L1K21]|uniref:TIGR02117 family protein n=1 Tax=Rhizobium sp. L1K21 TaxID=2954933 RepID=UPI00209231A9|nr:TIGR02117 family protein [Rhizobium sp. L1K21]MCO6185322.1 TIGR02117 family protein [Rhizobium sp. L1K21]